MLYPGAVHRGRGANIHRKHVRQITFLILLFEQNISAFAFFEVIRKHSDTTLNRFSLVLKSNVQNNVIQHVKNFALYTGKITRNPLPLLSVQGNPH